MALEIFEFGYEPQTFFVCFVLFFNELILYLLITTVYTFVFLDEQGRSTAKMNEFLSERTF